MNENTMVSYLGYFEPDGVRGGVLRSPEEGGAAGFPAPVIPASLVNELKLNGGELIEVALENPDPHHKVVLQSLKVITAVEGRDLDDHHDFTRFEDLPRFENPEQLVLSTEGGPLAMRLLDLFAPLGIGERGLLISEAGAGKTILIQQIANAIAERHPETESMMLLLDERPEEVTNMERTIPGRVFASSCYKDSASHITVAEFALMRARRLVEAGKDVFVLIDSVTELARAYNSEVRDPRRVLDADLSPVAIDRTLDILNSPIDVEGGGSLTILASAAAGGESELDGLVLEALRNSRGMEAFLSAELAELRVWPAIDIARSGTGCAAELLNKEELEAAGEFRKKAAKGPLGKSVPALHKKMREYESNGELLEAIS